MNKFSFEANFVTFLLICAKERTYKKEEDGFEMHVAIAYIMTL